MTKEEIKIRRRAIESSKKIVKECGNPCSECTCNGLFRYSSVSCLAAKGYEQGFADGIEEGKQLATAWIPVMERLPENEETVLITVEHRPFSGKPYCRVIKAFYEDGNMNTEDSDCCWDTSDGDWEYDEESDGYIIPEGWYEDTDYCEVLGIVGDFVLAWMPLPKPFKEGEEE